MVRNYSFSKKGKLFFFIALLCIICCKTAQPVKSNSNPLAPDKSDLVIAQAHWPGTTLDILNQGYSIYTDKCTTCHGIKKPEEFSVEAWYVIMRKMGRKAQLDSNQYNEVLHYTLAKREEILGPGK